MNERRPFYLSPITIHNFFKGLIVIIFLGCLSYVTYTFYLKTVETVLLRSDVVVNGNSLAPYQYRVLAPFSIELLKNILGDYSTATKAWIMFTITLFYFLCFYFFLKESGSVLLSMIFCLALWGAFPSGMWAMMKQEFLESSLILFLYHYQRNRPIKWWPILLITILSSFNRETFLIALMALGISLFMTRERKNQEVGQAGLTSKRDWILFAACLSIYLGVYIGLRYYYGLRNFDGHFIMIHENFANFFRVFNLWTINYAGAGILWIYIFCLIKYRGDTDVFILSYIICFIIISFFISSWEEHRIFYPLYPLILLQLLRVIKKEFHKEVVN